MQNGTGYVASRRVANPTLFLAACEPPCESIECFRDEREGEFDGTDNDGHEGHERVERIERIERETLRQDRIDVAKLSPARGEAQLYPVTFGWSRCGNRNGLADPGMRTYTDGRYSAKVTAGRSFAR